MRERRVVLDHEAWIQARRRQTEDVQREAVQRWRRTERGVITAVLSNGYYEVRVAGRAHPYDQVGATDRAAKFKVGDLAVLGFSAPGMPVIISRGRRRTRGVPAAEARAARWQMGEAMPSLGGRLTSLQRPPYLPQVGGGLPARQIVARDGLSLGCVICSREGQEYVAWACWGALPPEAETPGFGLYLGLYRLGVVATDAEWEELLLTQSEAPTDSQLQYGHLFYCPNAGSHVLWVLWEKEAFSYDLYANPRGVNGNIDVHYSNCTVVEAANREWLLKFWSTFRSEESPSSRPQYDSWLRGLRWEGDSIVQEWARDLGEAFSGYQLAITLPLEGRPPVDLARGHVLRFVSGWEVMEDTPSNSVLSLGQAVWSPGFPRVPCAQSGIALEGRNKSVMRAEMALRVTDGATIYQHLVARTPYPLRYESGHIGVWDARFAEFPTTPQGIGQHEPAAPGLSSGFGYPNISYVYKGVATEMGLNLGTSGRVVTVGNLTTTTPPPPDPPIVTDERVSLNIEIEGGWGFADEALTEKVYCASMPAPDLAFFEPGHGAALLPYPGSYVLGADDPSVQEHALAEWPTADGRSPLFGQSVARDYFTRGCAMGQGGELLNPNNGAVYRVWMEQEVFVLGSGQSIPQFEEETSEEVIDGISVVQKLGMRWGFYQRPIPQHCCRTILQRRPPGADGEELLRDISLRFTMKWPNSPSGVPLGDCDWERGTADNCWAIIGWWDVNRIGIVRSWRDYARADNSSDEGSIRHLPYRALQIFDATTLEPVTVLRMPDSLASYDDAGTQRRRWQHFQADPRVVVKGCDETLARNWTTIAFNVRNQQLNVSYLRLWRVRWNGAWEQRVDDIPADGTDPRLLRDFGSFAVGSSGFAWGSSTGLHEA